MTRGSIKSQLLIRLMAVLAFTWLTIGAVVIWDAFLEAEEAYQGEAVHLAQMATQYLSALDENTQTAPPAILEFRGNADFFFVVATLGEVVVYSSDNAPPFALLDAMRGKALHFGHHDWVVVRSEPDASGLAVHVGRAKRQSGIFALDVAAGAAVPSFAGFLLVLLAAVYGIRSGLSSLEKLNKTIAKRTPQQTDPIDTSDLPVELRPVVDNLNALFSRQVAFQDREKRFVADASHELRTPLAAAKAQVQAIDRNGLEAGKVDALSRVTTAIDRMTRLTEQLLALARSEKDTPSLEVAGTDLHHVGEELLSKMFPAAVDAGVELALEGVAAPARIDPTQAGVLLRNLVDNAIGYAGAGARVVVETGNDQKASWLRVSDSGPGIPPLKIDDAFRRFSRGDAAAGISGSGLGLSIVKSIADRSGAAITCGQSEALGGFEIQVTFPV